MEPIEKETTRIHRYLAIKSHPNIWPVSEGVCTHMHTGEAEKDTYMYICLYFKKEQLKNKPKTKGFING